MSHAAARPLNCGVMRLNSSLLVPITVAIASASAAESPELPRCENSIRILHSELAPLQIEHPPTGRVELEFTIDRLGNVSDPVVVQSTEPRLDREALRSYATSCVGRPGVSTRTANNPPASGCWARCSASRPFHALLTYSVL